MVAGKQWGLTGFDAHGHGHRCSRTRQVSPPCLCSGCVVGTHRPPAHSTFCCLAVRVLLSSGLTSSRKASLASQEARSTLPSLRDPVLSWFPGCLALHSPTVSLPWTTGFFFCHLPGRLLRDRGARMNPSGIEEGRRLPCNPDGCTLSDFAFQRLLPHRVCSAFACSPLVMGGSSPL